MNTKRALEFTSTIYDAVLCPDLWNEVLDNFVELVGAASGRLQVIDQTYSEHKCAAVSALYRNTPDYEKKFQYYFDELSHEEASAYEYIQTRPEAKFVTEYECLGITPDRLATHRPTTWMRDNFGIYYRIGSRLNTNHAWQDYLLLQFHDGRGQVTPGEIEFANIFIPHFAKAVELGRTFSVLNARFKAVLSALDHYLIGTYLVTPDGTLLLQNTEADRILECKDGLVKDINGRIGLSGDNSVELLNLISKVSATANGESMDTEQIMTIPRCCSSLDSYVLSICPLRDPENTLDVNFRGAIVYAIDPSNISIISTEGIARLYGLTPAEDAICSLLVKGLTTEDMAETRSVRIETVRSQVKAILRKTHVKSRIQLVKLALSINLPIDQDPE
ncbi:MAG: hypothetical protein DRR42_24280 [Gammaproteobacteria bacterium]|nr:MAG: hypothetical protein DRR42_24280 [Gammaproteobacteria bacterium]